MATRSNKIEIFCKTAFSVLFTLAFGFVFIQVIFANPYYSHYEWYFILPLSLLWLCLFYGLWRLSARLTDAFEAKPVLCLAAFFVLLTVTQLAVYNICAGYPTRDFSCVFTGAYNYTIAGIIEDPYLDYFYKYPNNMPLTIVLQFIFRAVYKLGVTNFFVVGAMFNAVCIDIAYLFLYLTAAELTGKRRNGFLMLGVLYFCLPLQTYISIFYTDTTTILYPPMVIYFGLRITKSATFNRAALWVAALGLFTGFGTKLKYSVIIAFIALCIHFLLLGQWKQMLCGIAAVAIGFVMVSAVIDGFMYKHILDKDEAYDKATPFLSWIAMSLVGDGMHNPEDNQYIWAQETHEEKVATAEYLLTARLKEYGLFGYIKFVNHKILRSFSSGDLDYPNTVSDSPMKQNFAITYLNNTQSGYPYYDRVIQGYHVLIFIMLVLGGALAFKRRSFTFFLPQLAAFGLFMFLIIWESGTRYLLNYYPIFVLCALPGLLFVFEKLDNTLKVKTRKKATE